MAKYLDPKADLTFKKVFAEQPDLIMSFLNAILPLREGREIVSIEYLSPEMIPENPTKKYSIVDVRCKDKENRHFIVEMQMYWSQEFLKRALFNTAKAFVRPLEKGDDYDELREVYSVNIINDIAFPDIKDQFYHRYVVQNKENGEYLIEGFELIFLELPKFRPSTVADKKMQVLWLRFLTEINEQTKVVPQELIDDEYLGKAVGIVEESAFSDAQLLAYDKFWDELRTERMLMKGYYRKGLVAGIKEGREEGRAEGREEERIANIHNMRAMNLSDEDISKFLNLDLDYVQSH